MIERQILRQIRRTENADRSGIILRTRGALRHRHVHSRCCVSTRIACWIGVHSEQGCKCYLERRLFPRFAHRRLFDTLSDIHKPAGNCPAGRRVAAFDQDNRSPGSIHQLDNNVSRQERRHGHWHGAHLYGSGQQVVFAGRERHYHRNARSIQLFAVPMHQGKY
jgi:hypothetical protein